MTESPQPSQLLAQAKLAFDTGNYRGARHSAEQVLATGAPEEAEKAREILDQISPAPLGKFLLLLTVLLLTAITLLSYSR